MSEAEIEPICAPLTAALLRPFSADTKLHDTCRSQLDRLYARVVANSFSPLASKALEQIGNEKKILLTMRITQYA
jgi:hypothetical protein